MKSPAKNRHCSCPVTHTIFLHTGTGGHISDVRLFDVGAAASTAVQQNTSFLELKFHNQFVITDGLESCHGLPAPDLIAQFVSLLPALFLHSPSVCSIFFSFFRRVDNLVNRSIGKEKDCESGGHRSSMAIPVPRVSSSSPLLFPSSRESSQLACSVIFILPAQRSHRLAQLA